MQILKKAFGEYATNCYILKGEQGDLVIDPGEGSFDWVMQNTGKIAAVLNTHGHFDHVYDDAKLQRAGAKIYIHESDAFMLRADPFETMPELIEADVLVKGQEQSFEIAGFNVKFSLFAGHTPGSCMIEAGGAIFSGDVIFKGSIGRWDFPFSDAVQMRESLHKILQIKGDFTLHPGHGANTSLATERQNLKYFLQLFER
ncbi:MBL fold metallo-hydrolase [Campylobacter gracilis]|uniref:Metallo-beta-lactamase domain protein n=1 Tax=Campylobacter gracilis RM3268 TaxID=553220 RepID=C8PJ49_9BACT|nr:MBL fold metallo-hydrolase [Campylobacter gracilis]AKT92365.1 metallo-beta-lactamase family protein [Campylobacter gracilis]EEV16954.1 metallo-beta-lactamase domain protein [Campylobacter gracilis RM3268]UEB45449.1 MBL fold metallo-hydrolase [Campylobacter gracilis]SUW81885.1 metallo-beta-lactamase family protein [Campylobacter gracilis]